MPQAKRSGRYSDGGGGARKVLDTDFRLLDSLDLIGGGTKVIDGNDWDIDNVGNATVFDILAGTGMRPWTNAASTGGGRRATSSRLSAAVLGIVAKFGTPGKRVTGVYLRLHTNPVALKSLEGVGITIRDTSDAASTVGLDFQHDGVNHLVVIRRDNAPAVTVITDATINGPKGVLALEYKAGGLNAFWGDGVVATPTFEEMNASSVKLNTSAFIAGNTGKLGEEFDIEVHTQTGNTAGDHQPLLFRVEAWLAESSFPR